MQARARRCAGRLRESAVSRGTAGVIQRLDWPRSPIKGRATGRGPVLPQGGREMVFDDARDADRHQAGDGRRDARRRDRAGAGPRLARRRRREGAAPAGERLHAAGDLDGGALPPLRRADAGPDPGGRRRADEGGGEVRSRPRRALLDLCGLVDQGVDPGLRDAQLVDGADRLDLVAEGAVLQPPPRAGQARARGRARTARCSTASGCAR